MEQSQISRGRSKPLWWLKYLLIGIVVLHPAAATPGDPVRSPTVIHNLSEEPLIADLRPVSLRDDSSPGETKGELSDFWKYFIAIGALVFFLGVALFIQIRSEREK